MNRWSSIAQTLGDVDIRAIVLAGCDCGFLGSRGCVSGFAGSFDAVAGMAGARAAAATSFEVAGPSRQGSRLAPAGISSEDLTLFRLPSVPAAVPAVLPPRVLVLVAVPGPLSPLDFPSLLGSFPLRALQMVAYPPPVEGSLVLEPVEDSFPLPVAASAAVAEPPPPAGPVDRASKAYGGDRGALAGWEAGNRLPPPPRA